MRIYFVPGLTLGFGDTRKKCGKRDRNHRPPRAYILANQLHRMLKEVSAIESNKMGGNSRGMLAVSECVSVYVCFGLGDGCCLKVTLEHGFKRDEEGAVQLSGGGLGVQRP